MAMGAAADTISGLAHIHAYINNRGDVDWNTCGQAAIGTMFDFLGFDYYTDRSDITGGQWVHYTTTPLTMRIPVFSTQQVTAQTVVPAASTMFVTRFSPSYWNLTSGLFG